MFKMTSQIETVINAYKTLSKIPSIVGGKLNAAGTRITTKHSVRNLDKGKHTKYGYTYTLDEKLNVTGGSDFGVDISNELLSSVSPKETFKAVIREEKDSKDAKKQYLEVWSKNTLRNCIDLTALELHGDVYADSEFGSLDWSQDESSIIYIAEKKLPKSEPYIKRKGAEDKSKNNGSGENVPKKGEEHIYRQDWGEQLVGKQMSVIVLCRLADESFTVLEGLPQSWCPGQVLFAPDGKSVIGVAWETEPRRLGLIFCTNRASWIFSLTLDGNMRKLSEDGMAVRSPRLSCKGDLVWLQRTAGGPHHACHAIVALRRNSAQISTVIDVVQTETKTSNGFRFFGVYCQALPLKCFSASGDRIIFSTQQRNQVASYVVNVDGSGLADISNRTFIGSTSVLDVRSDVVIAVCSNMTTPGRLHIARLPGSIEADLEWKAVTTPIEVPASVSNSEIHYLDLDQNTGGVSSFSALYFAPDSKGPKLPLIVWPHGGPHSGFVDAFSLEAAFFNMLGFASLQINYRGSVGAGQASVEYLLKRIGDADVKDCKLATEHCIKSFPIDVKKICLFGGSHGGFLVTHLSGQYPDMYSVVVSRNPVIDVASMFNSTDIADWCAVEAGFPFSERGPVSMEELTAMRQSSPIVHVHKVKAPTAMMLGSGDKRVPHYQGLEYARRLKANGVKTRVYMYDDNHSLSSLPSEMDNLINSASWFLENLQ